MQKQNIPPSKKKVIYSALRLPGFETTLPVHPLYMFANHCGLINTKPILASYRDCYKPVKDADPNQPIIIPSQPGSAPIVSYMFL